jgi:hypothetical protein
VSGVPLSVLDLVPVVSGSDPTEAIHNSIHLAQVAERTGYCRYWFAEHHLNPGVARTSPAVVLALAGAATSTIRIGSGAVQMGNRTALSTVEEFGLLDAVYPGRIDLGLGRSGSPGVKPPTRREGDDRPRHTKEGLLLPVPVSLAHLRGSPGWPCSTGSSSCRGLPPSPTRSRSTTSWPCSTGPTSRRRGSKRT